MKILITVLCLAMALPLITTADDTFAGVDIGAQIQMRPEIDGRGFSHDDRALQFTSLRTRLHASKSFDDIGLFVQVQDSRIFGSEPSTLASTSNVDLHQAYFKINNLFGLPIALKGGRFELSYGTQRFLGAVGWHYVGRSFDGAMLSYDDCFAVDVFAVTQNNNQNYIGNANPAIYSNIPADDSYGIYGFWAEKQLCEFQKLNLFTYYELDNEKAVDENRLAMATLGLSHFGEFGKFSTIIEAAYQAGTRADRQTVFNPDDPNNPIITETTYDIGAYLVSVIANYKIGDVKAVAGFDLLSGTGAEDFADGNLSTFAPTYGTNHKFYGYMDYFINIPNNTGNLGLMDINFGANWNPCGGDFLVDGRFHLFSGAEENSDGENAFGNELDLTVKYAVQPGTALTLGGSMFMPGEIFKSAFGGEDTAYWAYFMATVNL